MSQRTQPAPTRVRSSGGAARAVLSAALTVAALVTASGQTRADDVTVHLTKAQALEAVFPDCSRVVELRHILSRDESERIEELSGSRLDEGGFFIYAGYRDTEVQGYAVVVSQIGKVMPITHIVGVSPRGVVGTVAVMIYRESHGGEVSDERFMDQYRGRTLEDRIRIDRDIINIAGATLSGHAICRGVRKSLAVVQRVLLERSARDRSELLASATDVTPPSLAAAAAGSGAAPPTPEGRAPIEPSSTSADGSHLRLERQVMGTVCSVELYAGELDPGSLRATAQAALDEIVRWDGVLSDWREDTPLSRLNAAPTGVALRVDPELLDWLVDARRWWRATDGSFDPAVGSLVSAWGLRSSSPGRPDPAVLAACLASSGFDGLSVDPVAGTVERLEASVTLDPGASGKGFALDRAARVLEQHGVERALLSFRSTMLALGPPPGQDAWVVPIAHDGLAAEVARIELVHGALSVSGGSSRAHDDGGIERGHVIDPASGVPVPAERLAWVTHPSASASDALATALLVRGPGLDAVADAQGGWMPSAHAPPQDWPPRP